MRPTTAALFAVLLQKGSKKWRFSQLLEKTRPLLDEAALTLELEALLEEGWLIQDNKGRYALNLVGRTFTGTVETRYEEAYVLLPGVNLRVVLGDFRRLRVLPGDQVEVEIHALYPDQVLGRLVQKVAPSSRTFVGIVEQGRNRRLYVSPQQPPLSTDFQLPKGTPTDLIGQKVAVRFVSWGLKYPVAEVVQVLGAPRQHQTEMHAIVLEFGLSEAFPPEVLAEAEALPTSITPEEEARRHDFRDIPAFTIDPEDAQDFDDALSLRKLPSGLYEIGIHIADVSYYVRPDTALDREAYARGTSVYLVDRTLPMLPPRLSADLCSLKPNQDRLAFSVVVQMDTKARVHSLWMGRSLIRSRRRFTYEEAQAVLENGQKPWSDTLRTLNDLAKKLHASRMKEGGIRFETEEIRFVLDEQFRPLRLYVKERRDAHKLIEEFMLLANRQVAHFLAQQKGLPVIYRVHDLPKPEKLKALQLFLEGFGYRLDTRNARSLTRSLNELIDQIEGRPEASIIQAVAIRSLPKALYTLHNIGHYGLGFTHYTHFTSPIRRYPDLLTHRILATVLEGEPPHYTRASYLEEACRHCSLQEKRAEQAERASIRYKQLEYLAQMEGKTLEGLIVGIETWGFYVELSESRAEGLVSIQTLPTDVYERDEYGHSLKGRYTRRQYRLGDPVLVRVEGIDFDRRLVDLSLILHRGEPVT